MHFRLFFLLTTCDKTHLFAFVISNFFRDYIAGRPLEGEARERRKRREGWDGRRRERSAGEGKGGNMGEGKGLKDRRKGCVMAVEGTMDSPDSSFQYVNVPVTN
jgi:hypothetical protein